MDAQCLQIRETLVSQARSRSVPHAWHKGQGVGQPLFHIKRLACCNTKLAKFLNLDQITMAMRRVASYGLQRSLPSVGGQPTLSQLIDLGLA
jgi:hypothetical protein